MERRRFLFALAGVALVALGIRGATRRPASTLITSACQGDPRMTGRRFMAGRIPDARFILYPDGGHIWLGHDDALTREIAAFITPTDST